jgi:hypothetical protein
LTPTVEVSLDMLGTVMMGISVQRPARDQEPKLFDDAWTDFQKKPPASLTPVATANENPNIGE